MLIVGKASKSHPTVRFKQSNCTLKQFRQRLPGNGLQSFGFGLRNEPIRPAQARTNVGPITNGRHQLVLGRIAIVSGDNMTLQEFLDSTLESYPRRGIAFNQFIPTHRAARVQTGYV